MNVEQLFTALTLAQEAYDRNDSFYPEQNEQEDMALHLEQHIILAR